VTRAKCDSMKLLYEEVNTKARERGKNKIAKAR